MKRHLFALVSLFLLAAAPPRLAAQEVTVLAGLDSTLGWLESIDWWGEEKRGEQLQVPRTLLVAISENWRHNADKIEVPVKKEIFYRVILPLIVHANSMVLDRRERLARIDEALARGKYPHDQDELWLRYMALALRIDEPEVIETIASVERWREVVAEALYRLDVIPAGLALGMAAYESGWGTSRFAQEGNALFGQWSFGGEGLVPGQQRKTIGDHRIAAFEWPFDSVRAYFLNLSSHPYYDDFRRIRAELKAAGKPVTSLALADGLTRYSERGQAYVDDLKGIITANGFDVADNAVPRDEPLSFVLGAGDEAGAAATRARIEEMRESGEVDEIIERMRLE